MSVAPPLPFPIRRACSGSNGDVMAVAGGYNGLDYTSNSDVYVIRNLVEGWRKVEGAALRVDETAGGESGVPFYQAGVMIGNKLVCMGGLIDFRVSCIAA
jgi:hypothetical protein